MPEFQYQTYTESGELVTGQMNAASMEALEAILWGQGLTPFKLKQTDAKVAWWRRDLFSHRSASQADLVTFTKEFAELYLSEVPLDDCLHLLSEQATSDKMRRVSSALLHEILDGLPLADAMQKQGDTFPPDYLSAIRAGEVSGALGQAVDELADLLEGRAELTARIKSALIYPCILLGLAIVSVGIIVSVLVPSIAPIFEESGKPMPGALQILIYLRDSWGWIAAVLAGIGAVVVGLVVSAQKSPKMQLTFDAYKLKAPGIGSLILNLETARFSRTLGSLLKAGVPLLNACTSAQAVIRNQVIATKLNRAIGLVREGEALSSALGNEAIFPPLALRTISLGEETAKLDKMLSRTAAMFEGLTQRSIEGMMTFLTPALTILIAVLVGGLILTVMNAVLSINELATG